MYISSCILRRVTRYEGSGQRGNDSMDGTPKRAAKRRLNSAVVSAPCKNPTLVNDAYILDAVFSSLPLFPIGLLNQIQVLGYPPQSCLWPVDKLSEAMSYALGPIA